MINLFEIMRTAQGGQGMANFSRKFGLAPLETQRALEALLPAFSLGLHRGLYNPAAFGQILELIASGRYAPVFDGSGGATPDAQADALTRFFGSKEATRQVAQHGAALTGIGVDVMQQMLPLIAATLVGGLFRYSSLQGIGELLSQWSAAFHHVHEATRPREPSPPPPLPSGTINPFETWSALTASMFGRATTVEAARAPVGAEPGHALAGALDAWSGIVNAMLGGAATVPKSPPPTPDPGRNPLRILSQMFESGRDVQSQHLAALQGIFDGVWGTFNPRR